MRGKIINAVLEGLVETALNFGDLFDVFLSEGYGASYGRLQRAYDQRVNARASRSQEFEEFVLLRRRYTHLLSTLRRDGLIIEETKRGRKFFKLTLSGKRKLDKLRKSNLDLPKANYESDQSQIFTIVVFDIPEKERHKRNWLRSVLKNLGMTMVQKSVWLGTVKIPKKLLDDLVELKIAHCVEIFEISKTGSLTQVT